MTDLADHLQPCRNGCPLGSARQHLYALTNADDEVIYIGRTARLAKRIREHRRTKPWWPEVADVMTLRVCCEDRASRSELHAIRSLTPIHNVDPRDSAVAGHVTRRRHYDAARARLGDTVAY